MWRFIPVIFVVLFAAFLLAWRMFGGSAKPELTVLQNSTESPGSSLEERVKELEFTVTDLIGQVKSSSAGAPSTGQGDLEKKVSSLEISINDLKARVVSLEAKTGTTTPTYATPATSTSKSPSYIPLGWTGSSVTTDWSAVTGQEITIDTADYPGYTSAQFEVYIRIFQNGTAYGRLEVKDSGTALLSSEVSTTSQSYIWVTSSNFQLSSGKKTYRLQLKSLTGYSADVANARIKVNF